MNVSSIRKFVAGAALAATIGLGGAAGVMAQGETPQNGHPAHIHAGTCAELDPAPVADLYNLLPIGVERDDDGEVSESPEVRGTLTVGDVTYSETDDIELVWDDVLSSPHAIVVHESEDNMDTYIACGDIGGVVFGDDDDEMVIGLHPVGDSGFSGIAVLDADDDDEVDVEVYMSAPATEGGNDGTTVVATPEG